MLVLKQNPVGIDWYLQQLQTNLHDYLVRVWPLEDDTVYMSYGRCYRNRDKDNGYVAEVWTGSDYKEVFWDDRLTAISFFGLSEIIRRGVMSEADVHFVMFANLSKLALKDHSGAEIAHRADEELRRSVENAIGRYSGGFTLVSTELWLSNVLKEYPGSRRDSSSLKFVDMMPVHCFRLNLKLNYNPNKIC